MQSVTTIATFLLACPLEGKRVHMLSEHRSWRNQLLSQKSGKTRWKMQSKRIGLGCFTFGFVFKYLVLCSISLSYQGLFEIKSMNQTENFNTLYVGIQVKKKSLEIGSTVHFRYFKKNNPLRPPIQKRIRKIPWWKDWPVFEKTWYFPDEENWAKSFLQPLKNDKDIAMEGYMICNGKRSPVCLNQLKRKQVALKNWQ